MTGRQSEGPAEIWSEGEKIIELRNITRKESRYDGKGKVTKLN